MTLEEEIAAFKIWATEMGAPSDVIPSDEALKSLLKSRQGLLVKNLIERVQPIQIVKEIKSNILIRKLEKLEGQIIPISMRSTLPEELQRYLKIQDLQKQKSEIEERLKEAQTKNETLLASLKIKNIKETQLKQKLENVQAKVNILELKSDDLSEKIKKENEIKEKINAIMPVQLKSSNSSEQNAKNSIENCIKELEEFYEICLKNTNYYSIQSAKDELWKKIHKIFSNIPNFTLYNSILKSKEEQLQEIITFNKTSMNNNQTTSSETINSLDMQLLKAKAEFIGIRWKTSSLSKEYEKQRDQYIKYYNRFVNSLKLKMSLHMLDMQSHDDIDEIIFDYIIQYNMKNFQKGRTDMLRREIERHKLDINNQHKKDSEMILVSIDKMHSDIQDLLLKFHLQMSQLTQINEKIRYSKNVLEYSLQDYQQPLNNQFKINQTKIASNSIDSLNFSDNVFCSTKLDFENTINNTTLRSDITMINDPNICPQDLNELSAFMELPIEKLRFMPKGCSYYLSPNPVITDANEPTSTIQLLPGLLLTSHGSILEVKKKFDFLSKLRELAVDIKTDIVLPEINETELKMKKMTQKEELTELFDEIKLTGTSTKQILRKVGKYSNFIMENPLRQFVPPTKLFNNRTYNDYESEYQMYYRMATSGGSTTSKNFKDSSEHM